MEMSNRGVLVEGGASVHVVNLVITHTCSHSSVRWPSGCLACRLSSQYSHLSSSSMYYFQWFSCSVCCVGLEMFTKSWAWDIWELSLRIRS